MMRMIILIPVSHFIIRDFNMCIVSIFFSPMVESILYLYIHRWLYTSKSCVDVNFLFIYIYVLIHDWTIISVWKKSIWTYLELFINIYVLLRSIISEFPEGLFNITDWLWWVSYMLISNLHPNSCFVSWKFMVLTTLPHYLIDRLQFITIRKLNH
jgi:hypothetical protein